MLLFSTEEKHWSVKFCMSIVWRAGQVVSAALCCLASRRHSPLGGKMVESAGQHSAATSIVRQRNAIISDSLYFISPVLRV